MSYQGNKYSEISSAGPDGTPHYIAQRITAIALVLLSIWFIYSIIKLTRGGPEYMALFIASPIHVVCALLFSICSLYHGFLGMQVIIEDYIRCKFLKRTMLISLLFVTVFSCIAAVLAILTVHMFFILNMLR